MEASVLSGQTTGAHVFSLRWNFAFRPGLWEKVARALGGLGQPLTGRLYCSRRGWLLLSVPSGLIRGVYDALDEPGLELPRQSDGALQTHIAVMFPEELQRVGGPEIISERGHTFRYYLRALEAATPKRQKDLEKVWVFLVDSPDLERLRRSYGLSSRPQNDRMPFQIIVAWRRKGCLGTNRIGKQWPERSFMRTESQRTPAVRMQISDATAVQSFTV